MFSRKIAVVLLAALLGLATSRAGGADDVKTFHTFSLKAAEQLIRARHGQQDSGVSQMAFITRIVGLLVDPKSRDCILVGERDSSLPPLQIEDLVVMLRSVFLYGDQDAPGVSIDPDTENPQQRPQRVRYFGHIQNTRAGSVCFEADYLMKKIGLGLVAPRVPGVRSYYGLAVEDAKRGERTKTEVLSRFWYYPVVARVVTVGNGVLLDRCELAVLTEVLAASVNGERVMNVSSFTDAAGEAFATDFSDHFDELATVWPAIGDLRSLSTLAALARGLARTDARPDLRYWLNEYRVSETATPTEAEVLRNAAEDVGFEVHGGVHLQSLSVRLKQGDLTAFSEAVLRARPSGDSVSWTVTLTSQKDIFVPSGPATMEVESAAQFYARAHHLFRARQYDLAIAHWLQVARVHPDMGEVYFDIGLAFERKGMVACAAEYYSKALDLDPFLRGAGKRPEGGEMRVSNEQEVLR